MGQSTDKHHQTKISIRKRKIYYLSLHQKERNVTRHILH